MDYNSVKETASLWGVDPTRITLLCRKGRIPGALQKGREWLIPKETEKPRDARRKPEKPEPEKPFFPFYLYMFRRDDSLRDSLSPEQQQLYDAQMLYVAGDVARAAGILDTLAGKSTNRYILIGALVTRGFVAMELRQVRVYESCLQKVRGLLQGDFPYKVDLVYFFRDLESYSKGSERWAEEFRIDPNMDYHVETGAYLLSLVAYSTMINVAVHGTPVDISALELSCIGLENRGIYFTCQMVHVFLAGIYAFMGQRDYCRLHTDRVLQIAMEQNSYYPPATGAWYLGSVLGELLPQYPPEVGERIRERATRFNGGISAIYKHYSSRTDLLQLTMRDYEYIMFAIQGMQNEEIARVKGITAPTVSKYFSRLYEKTGVRNKKELVEHFRFSILIN